MADRLASYNDLTAWMKGGAEIDPASEDYAALNTIMDTVARRMATYILRSPFFRLAQTTSDGTSSALEYYGTEHYGHHDRTRIRLRRFPLIGITSIFDNQTALDSTFYQLDYEAGIIYRVVGKFYKQAKAVQVIYTAGFAATGTGDTAKIVVPDDLSGAFMQQCKYHYSRRQPGGLPPEGATTISRPDGSVIIPADVWLKEVKDVMDGYRREP